MFFVDLLKSEGLHPLPPGPQAEPSCGYIEVVWGPLGPSWGLEEASWGLSGNPWDILGSLGATGAHFGGISGPYWAAFWAPEG